jgi:putative ABC transport system permease protein
VLAFQVTQRTRELGLRMALGAPAVRIAQSLVRRTLGWLLPGVALGLLLGTIGASTLGAMLFGITAFDPLTICAVLLTFLAMVLVSVSAPLWRALQLNPNEALRHD